MMNLELLLDAAKYIENQEKNCEAGKSCEEGDVCHQSSSNASSEVSLPERQIRSTSPLGVSHQLLHSSSVADPLKRLSHGSSYGVHPTQLRTPIIVNSIPSLSPNPRSVFSSLNNLVSDPQSVSVTQNPIINHVDLRRQLYVPVPVSSSVAPLAYSISSSPTCMPIKQENNVNHPICNGKAEAATSGNDDKCLPAVDISSSSSSKHKRHLLETPSVSHFSLNPYVVGPTRSAPVALLSHDTQVQNLTRAVLPVGPGKGTLRFDLEGARTVSFDPSLLSEGNVRRGPSTPSTATESINQTVLRCLPNYEVQHHSYLQNSLSPSHGAKEDFSKRKPGNTPSREVHNKLEKNRRAHLKECFDLLKRQVPNLDEKKVSNQNILKAAYKCINTLKRKERDYEHEMERLAREKISKQQHLAALKKELSARWDHIDFNIILPDMATVDQNRDKETNSTATAPEQPDSEEPQSLQIRSDQFRTANLTPSLNKDGTFTGNAVHSQQNFSNKINLSPRIVPSSLIEPPVYVNQTGLCTQGQLLSNGKNVPLNNSSHPISTFPSLDMPSSVVTYTPQASPHAGIVGHCVTHHIVSHPSLLTYTPQPSPQSPLTSDTPIYSVASPSCNPISVSLVGNSLILQRTQKSKVETVLDPNQPLNLSTNTAVLNIPAESSPDSLPAVYAPESKILNQTKLVSLAQPATSHGFQLQQSMNIPDVHRERVELQVVNDSNFPKVISSDQNLDTKTNERHSHATSSFFSGVSTKSVYNVPSLITSTKLQGAHVITHQNSRSQLSTALNCVPKLSRQNSAPGAAGFPSDLRLLKVPDARSVISSAQTPGPVKNNLATEHSTELQLMCASAAQSSGSNVHVYQQHVNDGMRNVLSAPPPNIHPMPVRMPVSAIAHSDFSYKLLSGDHVVTNGVSATKPLSVSWPCGDITQSSDRSQSCGERLFVAVSRNGLSSVHLAVPSVPSSALKPGEGIAVGMPLNLTTSSSNNLDMSNSSPAAFSLAESPIVPSYVPLGSSNVVPQLLPSMMVTPVVVSPTLVKSVGEVDTVSSSGGMHCSVAMSVTSPHGSHTTTLVFSRSAPQMVKSSATRTLMLAGGQHLANAALVVVPSVGAVAKGLNPGRGELITSHVTANNSAVVTDVRN
ncbi:uncharacterized protein LOC108674227 isoform X2 [Hyalella azteca]|uniref:Max-binding protein MNT n=1 Tax=Hyalella azteca TaxID=294128 RepID=A0A8B7NV78_HYAAZ|nr:uncharacterized protein LOC108674227 isoform X2 [Hyalella azteca]